MNRKSRFLCLGLSLFFTLNFTNAYGSTKVDALKKKKSSANEQMKEKQSEIKEIKTEVNNVSQQISDLDKKMDQAGVELDKVEQEINAISKSIDKTLKELEEAEKNIAENQELFNDRIRTMYMTGDAGYLHVLLSSSSIRDFMVRKDMLQSIAQHDTDLIDYMKEQRDEIDVKKVKLETQKKEIEHSKVKLESRKKDLEKATRAKEDLMVQLKSDIKSAEAEYDKLNQQAKDIESEIRKLSRPDTTYTGGVMSWPVPGYSRISSPYGYRIHPIFKTKKFHSGIDIPAPTGTPIKAASDGTIVYSGTLGGYGKAIMIDHGGGIVTLYAHNSSLSVSVGTKVGRGQTIAKAGSTGYSTGPHCHFEVRKNGSYVNPLPWVKG